MSKFVNVDPILQDQYLGYTRVSDTAWQKGYWEGVDTVCDRLREAPTIDAVPVVRCRECKYSRLNYFNKKNILSCENVDVCGEEYLFERKPNDFCSYGERKEGADNES